MKNINLGAVLKKLGVIVVADGFFLFLILYLCLILLATVQPLWKSLQLCPQWLCSFSILLSERNYAILYTTTAKEDSVDCY